MASKFASAECGRCWFAAHQGCISIVERSTNARLGTCSSSLTLGMVFFVVFFTVIQVLGLKIKCKVPEIINVCFGKIVGAGVLEIV